MKKPVFIPPQTKKEAHRVMKVCCDYLQTDVKSIYGGDAGSKNRERAFNRGICFYFLRELDMTLLQIGSLYPNVGLIDHAVILYNLNKVRDSLDLYETRKQDSMGVVNIVADIRSLLESSPERGVAIGTWWERLLINLKSKFIVFVTFAPDILGMRNKSIIEKLIPLADAYVLNDLKQQKLVAKARSQGLKIDIASPSAVTK